MMIASERDIQKSTTRPRRSVHHRSFMWAGFARDEKKRSAFTERMKVVGPKRLVFVDESSTNTTFTPRCARSPRGERAHGKAPRNWNKNVTLISSITLQRMGSSMSIEGSSDTDSFGVYMREILAPRLVAGQIVVMDNRTGTPLSVHKSRWVREIIEGRGCELWLLPPFSSRSSTSSPHPTTSATLAWEALQKGLKES